uniref:GLOBIN domain-containing protein n=1 Tax=Strongyloides papillosus TaxID=174720 RepID=A0A0N5B833_STREA
MGQTTSKETSNSNKISSKRGRCKSADGKFKNNNFNKNIGSPLNNKDFPNDNSDDRRISNISSDTPSTSNEVKSNNSSKKNSTKEFLTQRQRTLLVRSWNKSQKTGLDNIGAMIFFKIYVNDPSVGKMFGLQGVPLAELKYKKFFQSHAMTFTRSLDFCISNLDNLNVLCSYCYHLGRRHVAFAKRGFKMSYWDTFAEALTECAIEWEGGLRCRDILHGWRKLITFVIDQMRYGYIDERKSGGRGDVNVMENVMNCHNRHLTGKEITFNENKDDDNLGNVNSEEESNLKNEIYTTKQTFDNDEGSLSGCPIAHMMMVMENTKNLSLNDKGLSDFANTFQGNLSIPRCNRVIRRSNPNLTYNFQNTNFNNIDNEK